MKKLLLLSILAICTSNVFAQTIITGGVQYKTPAEEETITINKYVGNFNNDPNKELDVMVKTDLNDNPMNLDCVTGGEQRFFIKSSNGRKNAVSLESELLCKLVIQCVKQGGYVKLIIDTSIDEVKGLHFSSQCHTQEPIPFEYSNRLELTQEFLDA